MKFVRFCYLSPDDKRRFPHQIRDGDAALQLVDALRNLGYEYGDLFINWPHESGTADTSIADFARLDMDENDVLLLTTRPPLTDEPDQQKPNYASGTELEKRVFEALGARCLSECSRTCVSTLPVLRKTFRAGYENRSTVQYYAIRLRDRRPQAQDQPGEFIGDASYHAVSGRGGTSVPRELMKRLTAGYAVHVPIAQGMPRLLAVFGMSGTTTLLWSYVLGSKRGDLVKWVLDRPSEMRFAMAEITTTASIPQRPPTLEACLTEMGWKDEVIAQG